MEIHKHTKHVCLGMREASLGCCVLFQVLLWDRPISDWRGQPEQPDVNRQRCKEILSIDVP